MRYLAAYLLATLGGNKEPSVDDISGILSSVGIEVNKERVDKVISELKGKDVNQLIAEGSTKLASVPSGGGGVAVSSGGDAKGGSPAKEAAKEEKKEEEKEESDDDMGFGLFD